MHDFFPSRALASETTQCHGQGCERAPKPGNSRAFLPGSLSSRDLFSENVPIENDEVIDVLFRVDFAMNAMNATDEVSADGLLVVARNRVLGKCQSGISLSSWCHGS
jgi:hypothetical protein